MSPDPIFEAGDPTSTGGYAYAGNDPTTDFDPTGKVRLDPGGGSASDPISEFANIVSQLVSRLTQLGGVSGGGYNKSGIALEPKVKSSDLQKVLDGYYLRPGETSSIDGDGTVVTALNSEMQTGVPVGGKLQGGQLVGGKWHINKAASTPGGLLRLLDDPNANLTPEEQILTMGLAQNLWKSITQKDIAGKVTDMLRTSSARAQDLQSSLKSSLRSSMGKTLGDESDYDWVEGRPEVKPPVPSSGGGSTGGGGCGGGFIAGACDGVNQGNGNGNDEPEIPDPEVPDPLFVP